MKKMLLIAVGLLLCGFALATDYPASMPIDMINYVPSSNATGGLPFEDTIDFAVAAGQTINVQVLGETLRRCQCSGRGSHFVNWYTYVTGVKLVDSNGATVLSLVDQPIYETPQCGSVPSNWECHPGSTDNFVDSMTPAVGGTYTLVIDGASRRNSGVGTTYTVAVQ
jgi:hypothetical protein